MKHALVFVTAPDLKIARKLAKGALNARLIACANIIPKVESHYWWQGKVETGNEVLILFKTTSSKLNQFEKFVLSNHPYETPEFIVVNLSGGNHHYLSWMTQSVN
jgi:periplasmic divalent cation tolerance protein